MNHTWSIPLGHKALEILRVCALPTASSHRAIAWQALEEQYSARAVQRKAQELTRRGYLVVHDERGATITAPNEVALTQSWLTEKGRQALEMPPVSG